MASSTNNNGTSAIYRLIISILLLVAGGLAGLGYNDIRTSIAVVQKDVTTIKQNEIRKSVHDSLTHAAIIEMEIQIDSLKDHVKELTNGQ